MAADISKIKTDIAPTQINFDNIDEWHGYSEDAIADIANDITNDGNLISNLINSFTQEIETHHLMGSDAKRQALQNVKSGTVFFIQS